MPKSKNQETSRLQVELNSEQKEVIEKFLQNHGIRTKKELILKAIRIFAVVADCQKIIVVDRNGNQKEIVFV